MPPPPFVQFAVPFGIPLISIIVAFPLVLQRVPPNLWYGFRTRKTLSDPIIWYRANYLGGFAMLYAGILALCVNVVLARTVDTIVAMIAGSFVVLVSTFVALAFAMVRIRQL